MNTKNSRNSKRQRKGALKMSAKEMVEICLKETINYHKQLDSLYNAVNANKRKFIYKYDFEEFEHAWAVKELIAQIIKADSKLDEFNGLENCLMDTVSDFMSATDSELRIDKSFEICQITHDMDIIVNDVIDISNMISIYVEALL